MKILKTNTDLITKISFLVLNVYVWFVLAFSSITHKIGMSLLYFISIGIISFILTFLIFKLFSFLFKDKYFENDKAISVKSRRIICLCVLLITLFVYIMYWLSQYPGSLSNDSYDQYSQAVDNSYSDWHPVLHTLLFFTLPIKLGGSLALIILMQLIYFSLAFCYLVKVLIKNGIPKLWLIAFCLFVWLNPYLASLLMNAWKDLALLIFSMVLGGYYIQIILSKGEWLKNKFNTVLFAIITVVCIYMRHNAILYVAPLVLLVLFYAVKKVHIKISIVSLIAVFYVLVQLLYSVMGIASPDKRKLETVGMPATIWCCVMKNNPDALPEHVKEKLYEIAPAEIYQKSIDGSFNSIKWEKEVDTQVIDDMSYFLVLKLTAHCFISAPKESFYALANLTNVVWGLEGEPILSPVIESNIFNISKESVSETLEYSFSQYFNTIHSIGLLKTTLSSIGFFTLILIAIGLYLLSFKRFSILHILPLLCYNFGTMLLLSGRDYRFFIFNLVLWLPMVFLMFKDKTVYKNEKQNLK